MYLRSVRLLHWACHDGLELDLDPGLNVVVGPNGAGKSTLCGAIIAALTVKYSSKDRDVRLLEPWGTDGCGPSVALDVSRPDGEWRLSKTFLHDASAFLERREGERWALRHKGRAAEEELGRWLDADGAAGRLLLELWSPQADPTRLFDAAGKGGRLAPASLIGPGLADRLGPGAATGPFALAKRLVADHVDRSFTPKNRQVKVGSELQLAGIALQVAEDRWRDLAQRRDDLARRVEGYLLLEASHGGDCADRDRLAGIAEERRRSRAAYQERLDTLRVAEDEARCRREALERFDRDHRRLLAAAAELASAEAGLGDLERRLIEQREVAGRGMADLRAAERRRAEAGARLDPLASALDRLNRLDDADRTRADRLATERAASRAFDEAETARVATAGAVDAAREALGRAEQDRSAVRRRGLVAAVREAEARAIAAGERLRRAERERLRSDCERLDHTIRQARDRLDELATLDPSKDGGPVPSEDELRELRGVSAELDARAAALDADAIILRFEADHAVEARFSTGGLDGAPPVPVATGEAIEARAIGALSLELEGVGRVVVSRTSADPEERSRRLEADRGELAERLGSLGAASLAELEGRRRLADRRAALSSELAFLLGGASIEHIQRRLGEQESRLRRLGDLPPAPDGEAVSGPIEPLRDDADAAERALAVARERLEAAGGEGDDPVSHDPEAADRRVAAARRALDEAERSSTAASSRAEAARDRLVEARARLLDAERALADERGDLPDAAPIRLKIASLRQELIIWDADPPGATGQAVRVRLKAIEDDLAARRLRRDRASADLAGLDRDHATAAAALRAARRRFDESRAEAADGRPPEDRERRLEELRRDRDRAEAHALLLRDRLGPDPTLDDAEFEARRSEVAERCRRVEQELAVRLRELELLGAEGLDSKLALAAEHLDDCRSRFDALDRDANAWRLLDRVLADVETDFARGIARRLEALSSDWVDRLTGRNVRSVTLDPDSLSPVSALPDPEGLARALEHFSRGTREQVALACRLRLGVLLAQERRQMILLDDPLAHTDPARHGEALDVLSGVARTLQILIFTCHQDRYARLWDRGDARCIRLGPRGDGGAGVPLAAGLRA